VIKLPGCFEGFRQTVLEDGEPVVILYGWKKKAKYRSSNPHAGMWSPTEAYVLAQTNYARSISHKAIERCPGLKVQSSETEILLLGTPQEIARLIGPSAQPKLRAMKRRFLSPEHRAKSIATLNRFSDAIKA
jgi:hypothetical protein